ncbi:hypothetical protein BDQ17DRAFT_1360486 [Cyathus striatus]|nr:hypothetical protein BDQ17DRAFT_1360486 [Cyathus striatus]
MKCPQCGAKYEIVSRDSPLLRGLNLGNRGLQRVGRFVTAVGVMGVICVEVLGVYILCTSYGAWAVNQFIGNEMFDVILTDNPSNWPWAAFLNLPLIPISLVVSRFQSSSPLAPSVIPYLIFPSASTLLPAIWPSKAAFSGQSLTPAQHWPPSPLIFTFFLVPAVRLAYRIAMDRFALWLLGSRMRGIGLRRARRADGGAANGNGNNAEGGGGGGRGLQFNEGFFQIRIRAVDEGQEDAEDEAQGAGGEGEDIAAAMQVENQDPNVVAVAAAQQLIQADAASLGRRIGGALILPTVSSFMGSLLFRLAKHSHLLRRFLGIRPHATTGSLLSQILSTPIPNKEEWERMGVLRSLGEGLRLAGYAFWNGSRVWTEVDPVWWRNSVGLGLFFVAKDCIQLIHLYLAKRELESRKVKNRDFLGVDIKELDLVPSFPVPSTTATTS